jgi:serine/threonine-protein kinase
MSSPPTTLGKYQIIREIARSNDIVYEAYDPLMNRRVALKELAMPSGSTPQQREERINRFKREARAAGTLAHPNIMTVYELGEEGDRYYIAMEFLDGHTLRNEIDSKGPLGVSRAVEIARDVLKGLAFMHEKGIIHRDIKPDNIQLLSDGRVKLTDFGIARLTFEPNLTMDGQVFGTPSYMSPEQVVGREIDARSDLFSLGIVLYEMLCGQKPFSGDSVVSITYAIMNKEAEPIKEISYSLQQVLTRAIDKSPALRYPSADDLSEALGEALAASTNGPVLDYHAPPVMGLNANQYMPPAPGASYTGLNAPAPPPILYPYNPYTPAPPPMMPPANNFGPPAPGAGFMGSPYVPNPAGMPIYYPPPPRAPIMSAETKQFLGKLFGALLIGGTTILVIILIINAASTSVRQSQLERHDEQVVASADAAIKDKPIDVQIQNLENTSAQLRSPVMRTETEQKTAGLYAERGSRNIERHDYERAESDFVRAIDLDPKNSAYNSDLADVYARSAQDIADAQERMELWSRASDNWIKAANKEYDPVQRVKLQDSAARATYDYGTCLLDAGDFDLARQKFLDAKRFAPADSEVSTRVSERLNQMDQAEAQPQ